MNKYKVTDINNASYLIKANSMCIETINNIDGYIAFYDETGNKLIAVLNLSNIIAVIKEN